jgi:hypothetical protein
MAVFSFLALSPVSAKRRVCPGATLASAASKAIDWTLPFLTAAGDGDTLAGAEAEPAGDVAGAEDEGPALSLPQPLKTTLPAKSEPKRQTASFFFEMDDMSSSLPLSKAAQGMLGTKEQPYYSTLADQCLTLLFQDGSGPVHNCEKITKFSIKRCGNLSKQVVIL